MSSFERQGHITGGRLGLGRALALNLSEAAFALSMTDGLAKTISGSKRLGAQVKSAGSTSPNASGAGHADAVVAHFGTVGLTTGIAYNGENVDKSEFKDIQRTIDVDFWGVVSGTKAFLPHVIASGDGPSSSISSLFGLIAVGSATTRPGSRCAADATGAARDARHPVR